MAEQQEIVASAPAEPITDMEVEAAEKRAREETEETEDGGESKKQKVEEEEEEEKPNGSDPVKLGPKEFVTSVAMFDYFTKFMHFWPTDLDVNKVCSVDLLLVCLPFFLIVKFRFLLLIW